MKPKLVILNHTGLYSGAEVVLERIVKAAVDEGWGVVVLVPEGRARDQLARAGAEIRPGPDLKLPLGSKALGLANRTALSVVAARALRKAAHGADLVLVNSIHALPALALARPPAASVWICHEVLTSRYRLGLVRATSLTGFKVLGVSEAAAEPVRRRGIPVHVIHNGTPSPVPRAPDDPPGEPVVGCAAALTSWKGQDVLLEAVAQLDRRVRVELLGQRFPKDAAYERSLRARAEKPDLAGRVSFLGFRDDVLGVIRSWTVAVSASVDPEAVGLTTLEAMSVGVPVVGTNIGATPHMVDGAGILVPPRDPRSMAEAITRIVDDPELWRRFHHAGPAVVHEKFNVDDQVRATLEWLESTARSKS